MSTKETPREASFAERMTPILMLIVVGLAFVTGSLWQKVQGLQSGTVTNNNAVANAGAGEPKSPYTQLSKEEAKSFTQVSSITLKGNDSAPDFSGAHTRGSKDAEVYLVEYSDLECPFCSAFHETAQQMMEEYGDRVAWVYKHFPLDSIHPKARPAAVGSECVASLGGEEAFWSFVDKVFADQQGALSNLADFAVDLGIDRGAYETCVSSGTAAQRVEDDYQQGLDAGVTGTPGNFLINREGKVWNVYGAVPYATLKSAVEEALN